MVGDGDLDGGGEYRFSQVINVSALVGDGDRDGDGDWGGKYRFSQFINASALDGDGDEVGDEDGDGELLSSFLYWFFSSTLRLSGSSLEFIFTRFVESKYEEVSLRRTLL